MIDGPYKVMSENTSGHRLVGPGLHLSKLYTGEDFIDRLSAIEPAARCVRKRHDEPVNHEAGAAKEG